MDWLPNDLRAMLLSGLVALPAAGMTFSLLHVAMWRGWGRSWRMWRWWVLLAAIAFPEVLGMKVLRESFAWAQGDGGSGWVPLFVILFWVLLGEQYLLRWVGPEAVRRAFRPASSTLE